MVHTIHAKVLETLRFGDEIWRKVFFSRIPLKNTLRKASLNSWTSIKQQPSTKRGQ